MKKLSLVILFTLFIICNSCSGKNESNYLSIAVTSYDDGANPENGMTITVLKYNFNDKPSEVGRVPYTSQYPLAVYYENDNCIYYSAKSSFGRGDQLWKYDIETKKHQQLTDSLFAINYIIPRKKDIILVTCPKGEDADIPLIFDKASETLKNIDFGFDFDCRICTYQPTNDRLIMAGDSYTEAMDAINTHNAMVKTNPDVPDYPPPAYFYELDGTIPKLLLKLDRFSITNLAIIDKHSFFYKGNAHHLVGERDFPFTQHKFDGKTSSECTLIDESKIYAYNDFVFTSKNDIYLRGVLNNSPSGTTPSLYHYNIKTSNIDLIYDSNIIDGYMNNFVFLSSEH